ncbi:MAG: ankyrin repeat domain-containing protein [Candidatus Dependentiae bacterium]|nr:ankyrin repeat domain-containing protein [Candidatus Dependentiae bacterium]
MNSKKILLLSLGIKALLISACLLLIGLVCRRSGEINIAMMVDATQDAIYDDFGYTPLIKAAVMGDVGTVKEIIGRREFLDAQSKNFDQTLNMISGNTALHAAIFDSNFDPNFEIAKLLIRNGANVRIPNYNGDTAIHKVSIPVNVDHRALLLGMLIKRGGNVNAQTNNGDTMLHLNVYNNEGQWVERLQKEFGSLINFEIKNNRGLTPQQLAIYLGKTDLAGVFNNKKVLLGLRADGSIDDVKARDVMGLTPFMLAIIRGDKEFALKLLKKRADINARVYDETQNSSLHLALLFQNVDMVKFLVDQPGIDVNIQNADGDTPLHYIFRIDAVGKTDPNSYKELRKEAAMALLSKKSNINIKNKNGFTPVQLAVLAHEKDLVALMNLGFVTSKKK